MAEAYDLFLDILSKKMDLISDYESKSQIPKNLKFTKESIYSEILQKRRFTHAENQNLFPKNRKFVQKTFSISNIGEKIEVSFYNFIF